MRILFDIITPEHAFFFARPIKALRARGHDVLVLSGHRGTVSSLLDCFRIDHEPLAGSASGKAGSSMDLLVRDAAMVSEARAFRPHAMIGFASVATAHAGAFLGIPSIAFLERELTSLQARLIHPAVTSLFVPEAYAGDVPARKTTRVPGVSALSYLHPDGFTADRDVAIANGLDPSRGNVFVRLGAWRDHHDRPGPGWSLQELCAVIDRFRTQARVHVSSDKPLPASLQQYACSGASHVIHHLIAHCAICVSDEPLLASQAAILGVRSVCTSSEPLGYIQELSSAGLVASAACDTALDLRGLVDRQVSRSDTAVKDDLVAYLAGKPDWSRTVLDALAPYAPVQRTRPSAGLRETG